MGQGGDRRVKVGYVTTDQLASGKNVGHRKHHVADMNYAHITGVPETDHSTHISQVAEFVASCADSRRKGITDNACPSGDMNGVRDDIRPCREIDKFAIPVLC